MKPRKFLRRRRNLIRGQDGGRDGNDGAHRPQHEGAKDVVRQARAGHPVSYMLEREHRDIDGDDSQVHEEGLGEGALGSLAGRKLISDEGAVRLHYGVVRGVQRP